VKIVFLAHYFPPLNSSGARRIQSFARYLSSVGHQITVISTKKTQRDGFLTETLPGYARLLELDGFGRVSSSPNFRESLKTTSGAALNRSLFGNFLLKLKRAVAKTTGQLVDHRLLFAVQFSFPWLDKSVRSELRSADIVMSTSPPWPVHLAGFIVKRRFSKPWVADYRDQFSGSHIQSGSPWFQRRELELERWFLRLADAVVTISEPMKEYYQQFHSAVFCIQNGYEESLFDQAVRDDTSVSSPIDQFSNELVIRYLGTITADRIPLAFFQALLSVNRVPGKRIVAEFYGDSSLLVKAISQSLPEVQPFVKLRQQLPYEGSIAAMLTADALFFIETSDFSSHSSRGVLTTKLFEYLAAKKPIIAEISEKALAATYIKRAGTGLVISENMGEIESALMKLRANNVQLVVDDSFVSSLSRRLKAGELESLLKQIINSKSGLGVA
jgi:glycosyltransferase involved in cell wall biosynthesis